MRSLLKIPPWLPVLAESKRCSHVTLNPWPLFLLPGVLFPMPLNITAMLTEERCAFCLSLLWACLCSFPHASFAVSLGSDVTFLFQPHEIIKIITILHINYHESGISSVYLIDWLFLSYPLFPNKYQGKKFKYIYTYMCMCCVFMYVYACKFIYVCLYMYVCINVYMYICKIYVHTCVYV